MAGRQPGIGDAALAVGPQFGASATACVYTHTHTRVCVRVCALRLGRSFAETAAEEFERECQERERTPG